MYFLLLLFSVVLSSNSSTQIQHQLTFFLTKKNIYFSLLFLLLSSFFIHYFLLCINTVIIKHPQKLICVCVDFFFVVGFETKSVFSMYLMFVDLLTNLFMVGCVSDTVTSQLHTGTLRSCLHPCQNKGGNSASYMPSCSQNWFLNNRKTSQSSPKKKKIKNKYQQAITCHLPI